MGKCVDVTVEVDLSDFDVDDLIEYLEEEGYTVLEPSETHASVAEGQYEAADIADGIKAHMLDLNNRFMHDLLADLASISRSSSNDAILEKLKTMM